MIVSLTGTPGTGKTTLSETLRGKGYGTVDLNEHIRTNGLLGRFDADRDTHEVDVVRLNRSLAQYRGTDGTVFLEGHLSHFTDCDIIIVLRCCPSVLYERLKARGYAEKKILENVRAEILDVILCEAADSGRPVHEIDTSADTNNIISAVEDILAGKTGGYRPGGISWMEEAERWF
jgi:adenylate kinase